MFEGSEDKSGQCTGQGVFQYRRLDLLQVRLSHQGNLKIDPDLFHNHPMIQRCMEYVDVAGTIPARLPLWIIRALSIHPEPQRPRCRRYELDFTKPKMWQFFETVYDETTSSFVDNSRIEEPRWCV